MSGFMKTDEHYVAGSLTLPQKYYVSDEMFAREQERIFKRYLDLCRASGPHPRGR